MRQKHKLELGLQTQLEGIKMYFKIMLLFFPTGHTLENRVRFCRLEEEPAYNMGRHGI